MKVELNKPLPNKVKELIKAYNTTNELKQIAVDLELPETTLLSLVGKRNYKVAPHNIRAVNTVLDKSISKLKSDLKKLEKITFEIR